MSGQGAFPKDVQTYRQVTLFRQVVVELSAITKTSEGKNTLIGWGVPYLRSALGTGPCWLRNREGL